MEQMPWSLPLWMLDEKMSNLNYFPGVMNIEFLSSLTISKDLFLAGVLSKPLKTCLIVYEFNKSAFESISAPYNSPTIYPRSFAITIGEYIKECNLYPAVENSVKTFGFVFY